MRKFIFGAKSDVPADTRLSNGYTLFDWAVRQNCFPAFWGRSVSGKDSVTKEEIDFLSARDCGLLMIFNDYSLAELAKNDGRSSAKRVIESVANLGIKGNGKHSVFVEIKEGTYINHNWMLSFAKGLEASGYSTGFIGNTDSSENFNFDSEYSHFIVAGGEAFCAATRPQTDEHVYKWIPFAPSAISQDEIILWQNGHKNFKDISYETVYAKDETVLSCIYKLNSKE